MHAQFHRYSVTRRPSVRRLATAILSVSLVAALAALPATPASASTSTSASASASASASQPKPSVVQPATVSTLPTSEVEELLADIPLSELSKTQLTEVLSKLPGLGTLSTSKLEGALGKVIEYLTNKNATVGQLLDPTETVPTLETELNSLLSQLELLDLPSLLNKGESLTTKLTDALGSLNPSQLLHTLLSSSSTPGAAAQLLTQLFATLDPEQLLGSTLSEPFDEQSVAELAGKLGMTPATLIEELHTTTTELPETAEVLTAPLADGKTLGVLNGLDAITLGLLGDSESKSGKETNNETGKETTKENNSSEDKETTKETNDSENKGTSKESTDNSGSGSPSPAGPDTTTVLVSVPLAQSAPTQSALATSASSTKKATKKATKIKILSHRVRGKTLTIVVQVPAAGQLALNGKGVVSLRRQTAKAERVRLRTTLTKANVASLRRHRHKLVVKLRASFKVVGGASSSASLTVDFA